MSYVRLPTLATGTIVRLSLPFTQPVPPPVMLAPEAIVNVFAFVLTKPLVNLRPPPPVAIPIVRFVARLTPAALLTLTVTLLFDENAPLIVMVWAVVPLRL